MDNKKINIIALSCSPSRGRNSDTMLDSFIAGANTIKGIDIEKIYLNDIYIENYNYKNSKGVSEKESDFKNLTDKLKNNSSGLIIATPTYNFSVPAHLKNFIDRIRFIALDLTKKNKLAQPIGLLGHLKMYFLVSGGTPNWAENFLFFTFPSFWLRGVFLYFKAKVIGAFYSGDIKTFDNPKILKKCFNKGIKYAQIITSGKSQGILENIFWRPPQIK